MPSSSSSNEERCFSDVLRVPSHLSDIDEKLVWACEARKADLARYSMPTHCSANTKVKCLVCDKVMWGRGSQVRRHWMRCTVHTKKVAEELGLDYFSFRPKNWFVCDCGIDFPRIDALKRHRVACSEAKKISEPQASTSRVPPVPRHTVNRSHHAELQHGTHLSDDLPSCVMQYWRSLLWTQVTPCDFPGPNPPKYDKVTPLGVPGSSTYTESDYAKAFAEFADIPLPDDISDEALEELYGRISNY